MYPKADKIENRLLLRMQAKPDSDSLYSVGDSVVRFFYLDFGADAMRKTREVA
ncbi:hypothetical protein [Xenorhabdus sp. Sc-CR9]|uniref:hypothetical protein n=1 Tax=Xenorhabdus sp. Sc-CR9 TaxID=2584468 RepID=UPI001F2FF835|nr:hypothetical protein [Xenorhabdus sp. Sc-CR9]